MTTLAQISPDMFGPLVPWLIVASAVMFLVNQAITFWKEHMREDPDPAGTYATKAALDDEIRQAHGRMSRERDDAENALAESEQRMRLEVARLSAEVSTYNTNAEGRTNRINARIDELPDKIVELLAKTKGLL